METTAAVREHLNMKGYRIEDEEVKVLARVSKTSRRKISETVEIRAHKPELYRYSGYDFPDIHMTFTVHLEAARPEGLTSLPVKKANEKPKTQEELPSPGSAMAKHDNYMWVYVFIRCRFLDASPGGNVYASMCIVVRSFEALGTAAFLTANYSVMANSFPKHVGTAFVSTRYVIANHLNK